MSATNGQELTRAATEARQAAEPKALVPVSQYATGFDGAASAPFSAEAVAVLGAPVAEDEVEIRPDGIVYMPGVWYRRQLSRAFGAGAWALLPRGPARRDGDMCMYLGALYVLGRFVSEALGECEARFGMSYASALEGARTDALTRCCKDLGMASELWDPKWRGQWQAKYADKTWEEGKNGGKGRWKWFLKATATAAELLTGRNSAAPVATPRDSAPTDVPVVGDTGEAPADDEIVRLQRAALALKWPKVRAKDWLAKHFGVEAATALTKVQVADALALLLAAAKDDKREYDELLEKLALDGRVTP